jgi:hypothetical protein
VQADRNAPVYGTGEVEVAADPDAVWGVPADIQGWPGWNPDITGGHGTSSAAARCCRV